MKILSKILFFPLIFIITHPVFAQISKKEQERAHLLLSPYHAVYIHSHFLTPEAFNPDKASAALFPYLGYPKKTMDTLAVKLKQILDARGLYIDLEKVPKTENYISDTITKENKYIPFKTLPQIYLEKVWGKWYYSKETVELIPEIYAATFPYATEEFLPDSFEESNQKTYFGLTLSQYFRLSILLIAIFVVYKLSSFLLGLLLRLIRKRLKEIEAFKTFTGQGARPITLLLLSVILYQVLPLLQFPAFITQYFILGIGIVLPVITTFILLGMIDFIIRYLSSLIKDNEDPWYEQLLPFLKNLIQIGILVAGLFYTISALHFDLIPLVAGLSIGGLAVALAAQDTFKHLIGSVTIFLDRPFKAGDWVQAEGIDGDVESIGFRATRIRTYHDSVIYIPNGKLADMTIDNLGLRTYRRYKTKLFIRYDTPTAKVDAFLEGIRSIAYNKTFIRNDFIVIHLNDFNINSLEVLVHIFFNVPTWFEELKCREEFIFEVLNLAERLEIKFANQTNTIFLEKNIDF